MHMHYVWSELLSLPLSLSLPVSKCTFLISPSVDAILYMLHLHGTQVLKDLEWHVVMLNLLDECRA